MPRHCAPGLRSTAALLAAALVSSTVGGAAAAPEPAAPTAEADPLADAQRLYDRGRAKFETADYADAIELWTEAYALVPDTGESSQIKVLLLYNIATARERQYEVSRDPGQLRQAAILLQSFERSIPALYGEGDEAEAERTKVQERLAAVQARLHEHEAAQAAADDGEGKGEPTTEPDPAPSPTPQAGDDAPTPSGRGLVIGGAVAAGLGVGGLGLMAAGMGMGARANDLEGLPPEDIDGRRAQFDRGRTGNALAVAGGVAGGVLLVTGAVLLGLGLRRNRTGNVALVPAPTRGGTALVLHGRF